MRSTRRVALTGGLILLVALGGTPFHAVEYADAAPGLVEAEVDLTLGGAEDTAATGADAAPIATAADIPATVAADDTVVAADDTATADDADTRRSDVVEAPISFTGLWAELDVPAEEIHVRTSHDGETWSEWSEIETLHDDDGPDDGTAEDAGMADKASTSELLIAEESNYFQLDVPREVGELKVHLADSTGANDSLWVRASRILTRTALPAEAAEVPDWVVPRSAWGADESATGSTSTASDGVKMAVVHHTASSNDYTREQVHNQLRIIQNYHIGLGWSDVGYNALVDRFGRVYEGRKGGLDRAIIGAHARNFNTGSFGVAVLGNFTNQQAPQAAIDSVGRIIGYKAAIHGFDPGGNVTFNGESRPAVVGHRDVGQTACPGLIQQRLPEIRGNARVETVAHGSPFSDIAARNTHGASVLRLHADGVINGCEATRFCPTADLTRGQAASLIARALDLPDGDGSVFSDVRRGATHEKAIGAVAERGIVTGFDDGRFGSAERLTRDQMASFLARAMSLSRVRGSGFSDVSADSTHGGNIYAIRDAGITEGCTGNRFCPRDHVTRAQMASFVDRMRDHLGHYE